MSILGGGTAGLALGFWARKRGLPFRIYEAGSRPGGNCITIRQGDFLFDSGAHRFHDQDPEATRSIQELMGPELKRIDVPSQIFHDGRFTDFPLSPLNLLLSLGPVDFGRAAIEVAGSRLKKQRPFENFENFALATYGKTIADRFLLNYSEKLWGQPCDQLSVNIAGKRMQGLNLKTFLMESLLGRKTKTEHLDGAFYYPDHGFGSIADRLADFCGRENVLLNSRITKIRHADHKILALELNGTEGIDTGQLVSTLPLDQLLEMLDPAPPPELLRLAGSINYRNVVLAAVFLDRESITRAATVYFPGTEFPFSRIYEPRNRSPHMAPPGQTSLVAEFPCQPEDRLWKTEDQTLIDVLTSHLERIGWIEPADLLDSRVFRMPCAYPVLERGFEGKVARIMDYLGSLENLGTAGRNGTFRYVHVHDLMKSAKETISKLG